MKKFLSMLLAVALIFAMTACGAKSTEDPATPEQEAATYAEHFVAAIDTMPTVFDPGSNVAPVLNCLVWDELIDYDKVSGELKPALATAWEWVDDTCTVLHMDLREGVVFHDGSDFTAADVEFSLGRCTNANLSNYYDHSEILDDHSMNIYLSNANADFFYILSDPSYAGIVSKAACEADETNGPAIGTGAWVIDLDNSVAGDTLEFTRNENYWGVMPDSKLLTLRYISSASSRLIALQNGEIHAMMSPGSTDIPAVQADERLEYCSGAGIGSAKLYYIAFNMKNPVVADNLYLRQAIACLMNNADIIAAVGDEAAIESDGTFWGYDTPYRTSADKFTVDLTYSLDNAKALLEKAKEVAGGTLPTLHVTSNTQKPINMNMCLVLQEACRQVGLTLEIDESDSAGINAKSSWDNPSYEVLQYNVPLKSWASGISTMLVPGSSTNRAILDDEHVVDLLNKAAATSDEATRAEYYEQIQVYVHDNAIYIPSYYGSRDGAQLANVSGIIWSNDGYPDFTYGRLAN